MRDAIGGAFLMYLILIFIVIYVTFLSAALKYVQAYRVKNQIINYIEQYEGFNQTVQQELEKENGYLKSVSYNEGIDVPAGTSNPKLKQGGPTRYCSKYGYCVSLEYSNGKQAYYRVTSYISLDFLDLSFINLFFGKITVPISGETRLVTPNV